MGAERAGGAGIGAGEGADAVCRCAGAASVRFLDRRVGRHHAGGQGHAGSSSVQSVSGGCALLENWSSVNGGHGKSLNAYNPAVGQWQQYWIGQDGNPTEFRESSWVGSSIVFRAHVPAAGKVPRDGDAADVHAGGLEHGAPARRELHRRRRDVEDDVRSSVYHRRR